MACGGSESMSLSTIDSRLAATLARSGGGVALSIGDNDISYAEIDRLSKRLLNRLSNSSEAATAIWSDGSALSLAAILGCLLHGRPWMAVPAGLPDLRIRAMLASLPLDQFLLPAAVLTKHQSLPDLVPENTSILAADGSGEISVFHGRAARRGTLSALPAETCCIFGTSGSSGRPKYVPLSQGNVASFLDALQARFDVGPGRRVTLIHELSSSASLQNLLLAFAGGATLCWPENRQFLVLGQFLRQSRADFVHIVPSAIRLLGRLGQLMPGSLPDVETTLIGGEILRQPIAASWAEAAPKAEIFNSYGPTEVTVNIAIGRCNLEEDWPYGVAAVGDVFASHRAVIIDADGFPLSDGSPGELAICGPQVAPGYFNSDEEQRGKFVQLPALGSEGDIWYRTGDLAFRAKGKGGLVVTGRVDRELKINGFRVNPAEIEAVVRDAASEASEVVVVALHDAVGMVERVVAFVEGLQKRPDEILAACRNRLPYYMVPSEVMSLSALPQNANGKIDYSALLASCMART